MRKSHFPNATRNYNGGGYGEVGNSGSGSLTVTASVSNGASRHAMPSIAVSDFDYAALFYPDNERPENPESKDFVEGTAGENGKLIFSFQKPDKIENIKFTLEMFAFVKADVKAEGGTKNFSRNSAPFSKAKDGLAITGDTINVGDIALEVNKSSTKPGTVSLKIKMPNGCSLEIDDTAKANFDCKKDEASSDTYTLVQNGDGILAGAYQVQFTVKKGGEIVNVFSEYINVLNGLCTDTWNGLAKDEAKEITQGMISSTVYVRGIGGWYDTTSPYNEGTTAMASDANSGSFLSPFATIQKAIDKIVAINDSASAYTILVDGTFTATSSDALANFNAVPSPLSVRIMGLDPSNKSVLNGNGTARGVLVGSTGKKDLNLTLKNLVITGGNSTDNGGGIYFNGKTLEMTGCEVIGCEAYSGGGVYIGSSAEVSMTDVEIKGNKASFAGGAYVSGTLEMKNCTVEGNTATSYNAGGIRIYNGGTVIMDGGTISGNRVEGSSSNQNYGGGVCVSSSTSTFTMKGDATISGNILSDTASSTFGSGFYVDSGTFTMEGGTISGGSAKYGGGVYVNGGTFAMSDGEISNCTAGINGGGVYIYTGTFTMSGGAITGNTANYGGGVYVNNGTFTMGNGEISNCTADSGGGVYAYNGTFTMSGGEISGNNARNAGGIYVYSLAEFTMSGGAITGNTATNNGGGVYVNNGTFKMDGSASVPAGNDGKNDVYLASGKTITIADALNATSPVATITPSAYTANRQVLTKGTNTGAPAITQDLCNKFAVTSDPNGGAWKIIPDSTGANGVLATTTFYVASTGSDSNSGIYSSPFATIQKAIDTVIAQNDGTDYTIYVDGTLDGTAGYIGATGMADFSLLAQDLNLTIKALSGTATLDGGAQLNENGTLTNAGIGKRIINAVPANDVALNLRLENLVIMGGSTTGYGAGVLVGGTSKTKCKCEMSNCTISGNSTTLSGGGVAVYGTLTMTGGEISGNKASDKGGGIYVDGTGTATLTDCAIKSCKTTSTNNATGGGGIYSLGTLTVIGGTISDCIAGRSGGGIYAYGGKVECSGNVKFSGCQATGSSSYGSGGGICINSGVTVDVSDCTFTSCTAKASGGGIWNAGTLTVSNSSFTTCSAGSKGGGICNDGGTLTVSNSSFTTCEAVSKGGGICNDGGTVTATDITYTDCTATTGGNDKYGFLNE